MIKHDMKFINMLPQYHTKDSKIGIQDHKAITNKVASLPWFIHKHDTRAKHATSIQVSTRRKGKLTIHGTRAFKSHPKRCGEPSCLDHFTDKRSTTNEHMFSNRVSIPTHMETKKTESWIPEG
jgi:hypothetical protein